MKLAGSLFLLTLFATGKSLLYFAFLIGFFLAFALPISVEDDNVIYTGHGNSNIIAVLSYDYQVRLAVTETATSPYVNVDVTEDVIQLSKFRWPGGGLSNIQFESTTYFRPSMADMAELLGSLAEMKNAIMVIKKEGHLHLIHNMMTIVFNDDEFTMKEPKSGVKITIRTDGSGFITTTRGLTIGITPDSIGIKSLDGTFTKMEDVPKSVTKIISDAIAEEAKQVISSFKFQ